MGLNIAVERENSEKQLRGWGVSYSAKRDGLKRRCLSLLSRRLRGVIHLDNSVCKQIMCH